MKSKPLIMRNVSQVSHMEFVSVTQRNILFWLHFISHICLNQHAEGKKTTDRKKK